MTGILSILSLVFAIAGSDTPRDARQDEVEYLPVDEQARIVSGFKPVYPPSLMEIDLFPVVLVRMAVYIDRNGRPLIKKNITQLSLPGEFICAAEQAVEKCSWTPARWGDFLVGSWIIYEVKFIHPIYGPKEESPKKRQK